MCLARRTQIETGNSWKIEEQILRLWWQSLQVGQRDKKGKILGCQALDAAPCHAKMSKASRLRQ